MILFNKVLEVATKCKLSISKAYIHMLYVYLLNILCD